MASQTDLQAQPDTLLEVKKRARRRLVGAIVLVIVAIIVLPLLLEGDPQPLGDQVNIQIPAIDDDDKFVSKLPPVSNKPGAYVPQKSDAKPSDTAVSSPVAKEPETTTKSTTQSSETFVIQLAAYTEQQTAQDLQAKLKAEGYPAYLETVESSKGPLYRVRSGPYTTRESAEAARIELKNKGYSGIISGAKQ